MKINHIKVILDGLLFKLYETGPI